MKITASPSSVHEFGGIEMTTLSSVEDNTKWALQYMSNPPVKRLRKLPRGFEYRIYRVHGEPENRISITGGAGAGDYTNFTLAAAKVTSFKSRNPKTRNPITYVMEDFIWRYRKGSVRISANASVPFDIGLEKLSSGFTHYVYREWALLQYDAIMSDYEHTQRGKDLWKRLVAQSLELGRFVYLTKFPRIRRNELVRITDASQLNVGVWPPEGLSSFDGTMTKQEVQKWRNKRLLISNEALL